MLYWGCADQLPDLVHRPPYTVDAATCIERHLPLAPGPVRCLDSALDR